MARLGWRKEAKVDGVISYDDAFDQGQRFYFTGEPCVHGHVAPWYVSKRRCVECVRIDSETLYKNKKARGRPLEKDEFRGAYVEWPAEMKELCRLARDFCVLISRIPGHTLRTINKPLENKL